MGVIQYHLYRLEREHRVVSARHGLYKRYYADQGPGVEERDIVNVLFQETERDLILYLLENPGATQKELSQFARISPSSTNWHMKRLSQTGFVEARRSGGFVSYTVKGDSGMILALLRSYHPRIWDKWAERLADLIS
jgi:predicted transcriptional regulator